MLIKRYIVYEFLFNGDKFEILSAIAHDKIIQEELIIDGKTAKGLITLPIEMSIQTFFDQIEKHLKNKNPSQDSL